MATNSNTRKKSSSSRTKSSGAKNTNKRKKKSSGPSTFEEIVLILIFALAILMLLADFGLCGKVGRALTYTTFGLFGVLGYIVPFVWIIYTCFVVANPGNTYLKLKLLMSFLMLVLICGACEMISMKEFIPENTVKDYLTASVSGKNGGGFFGGAVVVLLYPFFSTVGTWLILIALVIILLLAITEFSVFDFIGYHIQNFKDSYQENKEYQELKSEKNRIKREEQLAENRRKNGEKMLKARMELEASRQNRSAREESESSQYRQEPQRPQKRTRVKLERDIPADDDIPVDDDIPAGKVENPLADVLPKEEKKKTNSHMPSFLQSVEGWAPLEPEKQDDSKSDAEQIEDIINRELNRSKENEKSVLDYVEEDEISDVAQMRVSENGDFEEEPLRGSAGRSRYGADGMPVRKSRPRPKTDDTKVVETSGGRVIVTAPGTGGTSSVEAEGHETHPHGTADTYKQEDEQEKVQKEAPEREYVFPPMRLLSRGTTGHRKNIDKELKETALKLQQTLQNFGVGVNITNVSCGPAVTRYELTPEMGVKVSKIVALQDDIKLNLAASDIRIEAPIPGKAAIGIEVPNKENVAVNLRDLIESDEFRDHKSKLAFACGKDIGGQIVIGDIAKMPHLLIAGATGSGKSVCINTIIVSILYHAKPSEVKLLMIDPKVVELSVYNGIPHLLKPVVTDPKQAAGVLAWAVSEMTDRYKRFADQGVRDIKGYNEKIREHYKGREDEMPKLMPQIVIIVDELADLMMVAPSEVEDSILHLAQMARAAGMHLILATQRPSVNVITGVIKANIPSRIAFSVSSGVDSRTILDMIGAEKLLGKGDMLYYPTGIQKPIRVQGALVTDKEVSAIVDFLKQQGSVQGGGYDNKIDLTAVAAMTDAKANQPAAQGESGNDPLFKEAGNLIVSIEKASIGMLQRKFRIGFNRAARIMDQLCEAGVVGAEEGTKPRAVLMTQTQFEQYCEENGL